MADLQQICLKSKELKDGLAIVIQVTVVSVMMEQRFQLLLMRYGL